jgi:hypothetical protein
MFWGSICGALQEIVNNKAHKGHMACTYNFLAVIYATVIAALDIFKYKIKGSPGETPGLPYHAYSRIPQFDYLWALLVAASIEA